MATPRFVPRNVARANPQLARKLEARTTQGARHPARDTPADTTDKKSESKQAIAAPAIPAAAEAPLGISHKKSRKLAQVYHDDGDDHGEEEKDARPAKQARRENISRKSRRQRKKAKAAGEKASVYATLTREVTQTSVYQTIQCAIEATVTAPEEGFVPDSPQTTQALAAMETALSALGRATIPWRSAGASAENASSVKKYSARYYFEETQNAIDCAGIFYRLLWLDPKNRGLVDAFQAEKEAKNTRSKRTINSKPMQLSCLSFVATKINGNNICLVSMSGLNKPEIDVVLKKTAEQCNELVLAGQQQGIMPSDNSYTFVYIKQPEHGLFNTLVSTLAKNIATTKDADPCNKPCAEIPFMVTIAKLEQLKAAGFLDLQVEGAANTSFHYDPAKWCSEKYKSFIKYQQLSDGTNIGIKFIPTCQGCNDRWGPRMALVLAMPELTKKWIAEGRSFPTPFSPLPSPLATLCPIEWVLAADVTDKSYNVSPAPPPASSTAHIASMLPPAARDFIASPIAAAAGSPIRRSVSAVAAAALGGSPLKRSMSGLAAAGSPSKRSIVGTAAAATMSPEKKQMGPPVARTLHAELPPVKQTMKDPAFYERNLREEMTGSSTMVTTSPMPIVSFFSSDVSIPPPVIPLSSPVAPAPSPAKKTS